MLEPKMYQEPPVKSINNKQECLDIAMKAVTGDRHLNYGSAEDNFERIARLWSAWRQMQPEGNPKMHFTTADVAMMMVLVKVARLANTIDHGDSWIDIAGYAACGYDVTRKENT